MDNSVSPLVFFPLAAVVLVGAFSAPALAITAAVANARVSERSIEPRIP